jgi:hypothetical protein
MDSGTKTTHPCGKYKNAARMGSRDLGYLRLTVAFSGSLSLEPPTMMV